MAAQQIRLSQRTIEKMRSIGERDLVDYTDDTLVWTLCLEYEGMRTEIELLNMKLEECRKNKEK